MAGRTHPPGSRWLAGAGAGSGAGRPRPARARGRAGCRCRRRRRGRRVRRCVLGNDPSRGRRGGHGLVVVRVLDGRHEGLAPPELEGRAAGGGPGRAHAPAHGLQRDAGGDQDADDHEGHEQHGGAGGAETRRAGASRPARPGSRPPGAGRRCRTAGGALGQLGQATDSDEAQHDADGQADRIGAGGVVLLRFAAVDQEGDAGADDDERQEDPGPAGDEGQAGVGAVAHRAELLTPQRQGEQNAEGDQADGPQVAGLDAPERRARRGGGPGAAGGLLAGRAGGCTRGARPRVLVTTVGPRLPADLPVSGDTRPT